jgi:WD40 repeat protein
MPAVLMTALACLCLAPTARTVVGPYYAVHAQPFALGQGGPVAFSPSGRLLATVAGSLADPGYVAVRSVARDGALRRLPAERAVRLPDSEEVVFSPSGRFLAVSASQAGQVFVFSVQPDGGLAAVPGSPFWTGHGSSGPGSTPVALAYSANGKFLATVDTDAAVVSMFSVAANGSLKRVPGSPFRAGGEASWVTFSPNSRFLATANGASNSISVMSVAGNGALSRVAVRRIGGSVFNGDPYPSNPDQVAFSPSGGLLVSENTNSIAVFSVAANGGISQVRGSPYPGAFETGGLAFDATGEKLIQSALGGPLSVWAINANGQLGKPVSYATIVSPYAIAVSSQGFIAAADDVNQIEMLSDVPPTAAELRTALKRAIVVNANQRGRWTLLANGGYNIPTEFPELVDADQLAATGGLGPGVLTIDWSIERRTPKGVASRVLIAQGTAHFTFQDLDAPGVSLTAKGRQILTQDHTLSVTATGRFTPAGGRALTATTSFTLPHCENSECRRLVGH